MSISSLIHNETLLGEIGSQLSTLTPIGITILPPQSPNPYGVVSLLSNSSSYNQVGMVDITIVLSITNFTNSDAFIPIAEIDSSSAYPNQQITAIASCLNTDLLQNFCMSNIAYDGTISLFNVVNYPSSPTPITISIHFTYLRN